MKHIHSPFLLILVCLTMAGATGCSKSTSPTAPNNTATTVPMPTIGTTYIKTDNQSGITYDTVKVTTVTDPVHAGSTVRMITVTPLNAGPPATFVVKTFLPNNTASDAYGFQFHVVAR